MDAVYQFFKDYCHREMGTKAQPLAAARKEKIINDLNNSVYKSIIQATALLDLHDFKYIYANGFCTNFGYKKEITLKESINYVHPDDQEAFGKLYFLILEAMKVMPFPLNQLGHICVSYRFKDAYGNYHKVVETNSILEYDKVANVPILNLAQITKTGRPSDKQGVSYYFHIKLHEHYEDIEAILNQFLSQYDTRINIFNDREIEIANYIRNGLKSTDIAEKMYLSKHTIDKYRKKMLHKTGCANSFQLINYMQELNII